MSVAAVSPRTIPSRGVLHETDTTPIGVGLVLALAIGGVPALMLAIAYVRGGSANPWIVPLGALTVVANSLIVLMDLRYGLALFILTAGLSPKLPGIYDNLRVEDFIFVLVFGAWIVRNLQAGRLPTVKSPILVPFIALTAAGVLSTLWGIAIGTVPDVKYSFFLQAKRIEYFLIFWVVATTVRSEAWLRLLAVVFVVSGAFAALYGLANPEDSGGQTVAATRVSGPEGENYNTLSGYLVVCIGAGLAAIPGFRRVLPRSLLILCTLVAGVALLLSFSREGYIMLAGSVLFFGFTRYRNLLLLAGLGLVLAVILVEPVRTNIIHTVEQIERSPTDDPGSNSLTARYRSWEYRYRFWFLKQPLMGNGVGSVALSIDNEFLLRACESGIIGLGIFLWWLSAIGREVRRLQRSPGLPRILAIGLAAGFVGLLIQATVAVSFTSIRTMEPFWFLLGLVIAAAAIDRAARRAQPEEAVPAAGRAACAS